MKSIQTICLLFALSASASAFAGQWDSLGSKPSYGRGSSSHHRSLPARDYRQHDSGHRQRNGHSSTSVNIIVGAVPPISRWSPSWSGYRSNYGYSGYRGYSGYSSYGFSSGFNRRYNHPYPNNTFIFNSSLGYLPSTMVNSINRPVIIHEDHYVREYAEPATVIRSTVPRSSITLFKDRYGQCFEKETDRNGQVIKRQTEDYNCDF